MMRISGFPLNIHMGIKAITATLSGLYLILPDGMPPHFAFGDAKVESFFGLCNYHSKKTHEIAQENLKKTVLKITIGQTAVKNPVQNPCAKKQLKKADQWSQRLQILKMAAAHANAPQITTRNRCSLRLR